MNFRFQIKFQMSEEREEEMSEYKHPEVLVSTEWVAENLNAPNTRLVEVDVDTTAYDQGHIPGAVGWNWDAIAGQRAARFDQQGGAGGVAVEVWNFE